MVPPGGNSPLGPPSGQEDDDRDGDSSDDPGNASTTTMLDPESLPEGELPEESDLPPGPLPQVGDGSGVHSTVVDSSAGKTHAPPTGDKTVSGTGQATILGDENIPAADPSVLLPGLDDMPRPQATIQLPMGSNPFGPPAAAEPAGDDSSSAKTVTNDTVIDGAIPSEPTSGSATATDDTPGVVTDESSPGSRFAKMLSRVAASNRSGNSTIEGDRQDPQSGGDLPPVPQRVVSVTGESDFGGADYELLEEIGSGAMGTIYAARQKGVERTVALKTIKEDVDQNRENVEKFLYEAQITGDLDHPNIVPIHELGANADGTLFYSMKLVKGTPWQDVMANQSVDENLDILMKVADALSFAHSRGVIHRDLKPENVMLGDYGEVLLMDWGLAVNLNKQANFAFGGTPAYMAPEMAYHLVPQIGFTSDVYLLGAVLYQIVNGCAPHPGESAQSCLEAAARNEFVPAVRQDGLTAIAYQAMATHPNQRYASVAQFQEAIRQYRRHAESVLMAGRAQEALETAMRDGDYDSFSRAVFGFQDAIDLWPENQVAVQGLAQSRLEFGRRALDDNNLQLTLRVLDPGIPSEAEYVKEAKKRLRVEQAKDRRMRVLRTSIAIVILLSCAGLSVLALFANNKRLAAEQASIEAEEERQKAIAARDDAKKQEARALVLQGEAEEARDDAKESEAEAKKQEGIAVAAAEEALKQEGIAQDALGKLQVAFQDVKKAQQLAQENLADALNGTYQSQLGLVFAQLQNADLGRATTTLLSIAGADGNGGIQQQWLAQATQVPQDDEAAAALQSVAPDLTNWVYRRASLLTNRDLVSIDLGENATHMAVAWQGEQQTVAIALANQTVVFFRRDPQSGQFASMDAATVAFPKPIVELAISSDGKDVACLIAETSRINTLYGWRIGTKPTAPLNNEAFNKVRFTEDGRQLWGLRGNGSSGTRVWNLSENGIGEPLPKLDKAGVGAAETSVWSVTPDSTVRIFAPLPLRESRPSHLWLLSNVFQMNQGIPWDLISKSAKQLTTISIEPDKQHFLLGFDDGTIVRCALPAQSTEELQKREKVPDAMFDPMVLVPNPHFAAIHTIQFSANGQFMLTGGQQSDMHRWKRSDIDLGWEPAQTLLGHSSSIVAASMSPDATRGLSADREGRVLEWDFSEQERRQRAELPQGITPAVFGQVFADRFVCFDEDALLRNERTSRSADSRLGASYFGHTPGTSVYTVASTADGETIATAAALDGSNRYAMDEPVIEVCLWSSDGRFLQRIHLPNQLDSPTISLSNDAKWLAIAGRPTIVWNLETNREQWRAITSANTEAGSNNVALAPSGTLIAYHGPNKLYVADFAQNQILGETDEVIALSQVAWSPRGDRLFTLDRVDNVTQRSLDDLSEVIGTAKSSERPGSSTLWTPHFTVQDAGPGRHRVFVIYHHRTQAKSVFSSFDFDSNSAKLQLSAEFDSWRLLEDNGNVVDYVPADATRIRRQTIASPALRWIIEGGDVFQLIDAPQIGMSIARTGCSKATSNDQLTVAATLHDNGTIWLWDMQGESVAWTPFRPNLRFQDMAMSPDGQLLATIEAVDEALRLRVWDVASQQEKLQSPAGSAFCWMKGRLMFVDPQGTATQWDSATEQTTNLPFQLPATTVDLYPFVEPLRHPQTTREYLISRNVLEDGRHELAWHPLDAMAVDGDGGNPAGAGELRAANFRLRLSDLAAVTTSPNEGLLVTGTREGSTTVWFCSPSVDTQEPREMLNLRGHMGAQLLSITFDAAGNALTTTDDKLRNYVWHSTIE